MKQSLVLAALFAGTIALAGCGGSSSTSAVPPTSTIPANVAGPTVSSDLRELLSSGKARLACDAPLAGDNASCFSVVLTESGRQALGLRSTDASTPSGYFPADLASAYNESGTGGRLVGIVDAYDDPNLESDLAVYRNQFGLPPCTTANGCFKKVGQTGTSTLPKTNASWAEETSLDVDMVSANCPNCKILVVEANSATTANLAASVNTAVSLGAVAVSNSYGSSESSGELTYASNYNHPGVAITVSNGDSGYGAATPASYNTIIAVGGTNLKRSSTTRGWSEVVWTGSGSGCSAYISKPTWQTDTGCAKRTIGDIGYDADPNTGVAVYDSLSYRGQSGWLVFGGTSVGAPAIAALYGRSGDTVSDASKLYTSTSASGLNDVTSGSNGTCSVAYLCTAGVGYDGPTGNGTPNGLTAF